MSRWAVYVALTLSLAGCTRLNAAFVDQQGDTGTSTSTSGVTEGSTLGTTAGSNTTTDASSASDAALTTADPTGPETQSGDSTSDERCFTLHAQNSQCELESPRSCIEGHCRPYGDDESLSGIGCVEQPEDVQQLELGEQCTHKCDPFVGADGCPPGSACDPFANNPTCVEFCDPEEDASCGGDSRCFEHFAGEQQFGLCRPGCDALARDCPAEQTCVPMMRGPAQCRPAGDAEAGQKCALVSDCAIGLACLTDHDPGCEDGACCVELCSVRLDDCSEGYTCLPLWGGVFGGCALDE